MMCLYMFILKVVAELYYNRARTRQLDSIRKPYCP